MGWAWFEAGWVRLETLAVRLDGLPNELAGLRLAHLSDFHLGVPGRGVVAAERAVAWVAERRPDLTLVSGDLLTRASGEARLRELIGRLPNCYAILGNHDPAAMAEALEDLGFKVLVNESTVLTRGGEHIVVTGLDDVHRFFTSDALAALSRAAEGFRIALVHSAGSNLSSACL